MAAATMAICSGLACTSRCPIDDCARAARPSLPLAGSRNDSGKWEAAAPGRSMGGTWLKPNASEVLIIPSAPTSSPICANDELQDLARTVNRVPPQAAPPKLRMGRRVPGGVYDVTTGYDGVSFVTLPDTSPA